MFWLLCGLTQQIILGWFWPSMVLGESLPEASGLRILMRSNPLFDNPQNFAPHNFTRFPYPTICRSLDCFQVWSFIAKGKLVSPQNFQATGCKNIALHYIVIRFFVVNLKSDATFTSVHWIVGIVNFFSIWNCFNYMTCSAGTARGNSQTGWLLGHLAFA